MTIAFPCPRQNLLERINIQIEKKVVGFSPLGKSSLFSPLKTHCKKNYVLPQEFGCLQGLTGCLRLTKCMF